MKTVRVGQSVRCTQSVSGVPQGDIGIVRHVDGVLTADWQTAGRKVIWCEFIQLL